MIQWNIGAGVAPSKLVDEISLSQHFECLGGGITVQLLQICGAPFAKW